MEVFQSSFTVGLMTEINKCKTWRIRRHPNLNIDKFESNQNSPIIIRSNLI